MVGALGIDIPAWSDGDSDQQHPVTPRSRVLAARVSEGLTVRPDDDSSLPLYIQVTQYLGVDISLTMADEAAPRPWRCCNGPWRCCMRGEMFHDAPKTWGLVNPGEYL